MAAARLQLAIFCQFTSRQRERVAYRGKINSETGISLALQYCSFCLLYRICYCVVLDEYVSVLVAKQRIRRGVEQQSQLAASVRSQCTQSIIRHH